MSRILKSNWGVAALVCAALYVVTSNVVMPLLASEEIQDDIPFLDETDEAVDESGDIVSLKSVNTSLLYWNDKPQRDPFGQKIHIASAELTEVKKLRDQRGASENVVKTGSKPASGKVQKQNEIIFKPLPVISGFVAGENSRYAVLNNQIMGEGESIDDYLIVAITQQGVDLRHPDGLSTITLVVTP